MMSTERRASGFGPTASASSPQAHNHSAMPRDMQRPSSKSGASSAAAAAVPPPPPGSPDRKRPRYDSSLSSRGMADEEELDELEETEENTRPRGESDEPKVMRKGSGPEPVSRSSSAAAHHAHWAGRSTSAVVDSRYQQQQSQHQQQQQQQRQLQHRTREGMDTPDSRRYEFERPLPSRYDSGPAGVREEAGRPIGGLVGDRFGGEADREHRDRMAGPTKMDYASPSMRMPPPSGMGDSGMPNFRNRPPSPPPRLPSFASLEPEGLGHRPRDDGPMGGAFSSSPRRGLPFPGPSYGSYPHPPNRTPLMQHHPSPTPSTSYGNPPVIHPALAGLPGAGGGPGGKQQPSFVSKLYSMLEDPSISDLISWGASGSVFSVANPAEFSRLVLPNWFKHSNWQSFVRQLNMYGFHKVNHSYQGNPTDEVQVWEFRHPSFRRGEIALLNDIKRKSSRQKRGGSPSMGGDNMRADRSGGSSTPSPEVSLSSLPEGMRMGGGGMRGREFGYDDRDPHGYERREMRYGEHDYSSGPRGPQADEYYMRTKMEGHPIDMAAATGVAPPFAPDARRGGEPFMDRNETIARFDDLSERTDAIIRHSSFLESQIRTMADQLADSRAVMSQMVREEMVQMLDRLERALSSPSQPGVDPTARMVEVIRGQLAFYSRVGMSDRIKPTAGQPMGAAADQSRPSI